MMGTRGFGRQASNGKRYLLGIDLALVEFNKDELCSCEAHEPPRQYGDCCRPAHPKRGLLELKADFERKMSVRITDRNPPTAILDYLDGRGSFPKSSRWWGCNQPDRTPESSLCLVWLRGREVSLTKRL